MLSAVSHATICFILMISAFDHANSQNISITRGERDVFTNTGNCIRTKAVCFDKKCTYCQCPSTRQTFVATRGQYGECVPNEYLVYATSFNLSFLAQDTKKKFCVDHYRGVRDRVVGVNRICDTNAMSQRWFWTKNGHFLNLDILECITIGWKGGKDNQYYFLIMDKCVSNNKKQLWQCGGDDPYHVWQPMSKGYLHHGDFKSFVLSHGNRRKALRWKRYGSNRTLCSQAVGCDMLQDGTSLVLLNQTKCHGNSECWGEKEINVGEKVTGCSLVLNQVMYIHKGEWQRLAPVEPGSFDVVTYGHKTSLKWDLSKTPRSWKGLIVKVQFECKRGEKNEDAHCVLIKYSGLFTGFEEPDGSDKQKEKSKDGNDKTEIAVIAVCVLIIVFALGIVAFCAYRNKDRLVTFLRTSTPKPGVEKTGQTSTGQRSGHSSNPIYNSTEGKPSAQTECALYDVTNPQPVHHYATPEEGIEAQTPPQDIYDYASPENRVKFAQRAFLGNEGDSTMSQNAPEPDSSQDKNHVYHILENN